GVLTACLDELPRFCSLSRAACRLFLLVEVGQVGAQPAGHLEPPVAGRLDRIDLKHDVEQLLRLAATPAEDGRQVPERELRAGHAPEAAQVSPVPGGK